MNDFINKLANRTENDCAIISLYVVSHFYNLKVDYAYIKKLSKIQYNGMSLYDLNNVAQKIGFKSCMVQIPFEKLNKIPLPSIALINKNHYVVIFKIHKKKYFLYFDPNNSRIIKIAYDKFIDSWIINQETKEGILLLLEI